MELVLLPTALAAAHPRLDPRNIAIGSVIPDEGYSDQPCVVVTNDGNWRAAAPERRP